MTSSDSKPQSKIWMQMAGALCLYLALELGLFAGVKQALRTTAGELAVPFLAFAMAGVIGLLLTWRLRKWEENAPSPKLVALGWCLATALLFLIVAFAIFYSGVKLHLLNPRDAKTFIVLVFAGVLIASFSLYRMVLSRISARATEHTDRPQPQ